MSSGPQTAGACETATHEEDAETAFRSAGRSSVGSGLQGLAAKPAETAALTETPASLLLHHIKYIFSLITTPGGAGGVGEDVLARHVHRKKCIMYMCIRNTFAYTCVAEAEDEPSDTGRAEATRKEQKRARKSGKHTHTNQSRPPRTHTHTHSCGGPECP